jgi:hypothetical protein
MALFTTTPLPTLGEEISVSPFARRASVGAAPGCTNCRRANVGELPSLPTALLICGAVVFLIAVL